MFSCFLCFPWFFNFFYCIFLILAVLLFLPWICFIGFPVSLVFLFHWLSYIFLNIVFFHVFSSISFCSCPPSFLLQHIWLVIVVAVVVVVVVAVLVFSVS